MVHNIVSMQPLKIGNISIPAWLIIGVATVFVIGWLMTFNDITFINISEWIMDRWKEAKR